MGGRQRTRAWGATGPAFPLFAEVLLVGVVVGLASLPLVTALPAGALEPLVTTGIAAVRGVGTAVSGRREYHHPKIRSG